MTAELTLEDLRRDYAKLLDRNEPIESRMRELYLVKGAALHTLPGALFLLEAVDTTDSVLLQHELAYNVGQSGCVEAIPGLAKIVADARYDPVTRHEAAESLGAIGSPEAIQVLEKHADPAVESEAAVRETCEIALERIKMKKEKGEAAVASSASCPFVSVDPSPAFTAANSSDDAEGIPQTVEELEAVLLDTSGKNSLFRRYMAMFSLRNLATDAAVEALCRALREDTTSALLRHEVAFVLGQLEHRKSQPALIAALTDENEAAMVRHEAAEALGAIADPAQMNYLEDYAKHHEPLVQDSCLVAIEMQKYWSQFANNNDMNKTTEEAEKAAN